MANLKYESRSNDSTSDASVARIDMKLEVVVIPVSDVDRAKEFYGRSSGGASTPTTTTVKTSA